MSLNRGKLLTAVEAYLKSTGAAATRLGQEACKYSNLVSRLRFGLPITDQKAQQLWDFMEKHPEGTDAILSRKEGVGVRLRRRATIKRDSANNRDELPNLLKYPTPALSQLKPGSVGWLRQESMRQKMTIAEFLADLVELGITCYIEDQKEGQN